MIIKKEKKMQLLFITLKDSEEFLKTLSGLKKHGMNGVVLPSTSLKNALLHSEVEDVPSFGGLSKVVDHTFEEGHTVFMLINEEKLEEAKEVVHSIAENLESKGVMFSVPVTFWEGLRNK